MKKGQITIPVLIGFIIVLLIYIPFMPILEDLIADTMLSLDPSSPYYTIQIMIMHLITTLILLMILVGLINYAVPYREPYGGGGY